MKDFKDFDELDRRTRTIKQSTYNNIKYEIAGYKSNNAFGMACAYVYLTHDQYRILLSGLLEDTILYKKFGQDRLLYKDYEALNIPGVHGGFTFGVEITTEYLAETEKGENTVAHSMIKLGWDYCHYDNSLFTSITTIQTDIETAIDFIQEVLFKQILKQQSILFKKYYTKNLKRSGKKKKKSWMQLKQ